MNVIDIIKKLEDSKEFTSWIKNHKKAYLAHCFRMLDEVNSKIWQIGYFNPESNLITVFVVDDKITRNEDSEVFKEQKKLVNRLDVKEVKVTEDKALDNANEILGKEYKGSTVFKSFMILQNIDKIGQVWNITFVTQQFKTINIKIDSLKGTVIDHKMVSLIRE